MNPVQFTGFEFSGICIQNARQLVNLVEGARFYDCRFTLAPATSNNFSVGLLDADGAQFIRCSFDGSGSGEYIVGFVGGHNPNTVVDRCSFMGNIGSAINTTGADNLRVEDCEFSGVVVGGMAVGIVMHATTNAIVRGCRLQNIHNIALSVEEGSDVVLENCDLGPTMSETLVVAGGSRVIGSFNRIQGGGVATVSTNGGVEIRLSEGDILNGGGLSVKVISSAAYTPAFDLRNNYWGTTDVNQIATWIQDGSDPSPPVCSWCPVAVVEYLPILSATVPAAESSFGGLKARYSGESQ